MASFTSNKFHAYKAGALRMNNHTNAEHFLWALFGSLLLGWAITAVAPIGNKP